MPHKKSSAVQPPSSQLPTGSKWHSVALLELLLSNAVEMQRLLEDANVGLLPLHVAVLRPGQDQYDELTFQVRSRLSDPDGAVIRAEKANPRTELNLSQLVPGLLGLFAVTVVNKGVPVVHYTGIYMLPSEEKKFEDKHGFDMGVTISHVLGYVDPATVEELVLMGSPTSPACQALHSTKKPKPNCHLSSKEEGLRSRSFSLRSKCVLRPGDELFINYSRTIKQFAVSCFHCHLRIADEERSDSKSAFHCLGFINASPCPRIVHRACAVKRGVVGDYCHFCAIESGKDDECMHPSAQQIMRLVPVECDARSSQHAQQYASDVGCVIHSNLSFAAVLNFACGEGFDVIHAKPVDGESYTPIKATERKKYCCTRLIEYRLHPQRDTVTDGELSCSSATGESQLSLHSDIDSDYCSVASTLRSASEVELSLSLIGRPGREGFGCESEFESDEDAASDDDGESEYTGSDLPTNEQNSTTFAEGYAAFRRGAGAAAATPAASLRGMLLDAGVPMIGDDAVDELSDISWKSEDFVRLSDDSDDDYSDTRHCNVRTRSHK